MNVCFDINLHCCLYMMPISELVVGLKLMQRIPNRLLFILVVCLCRGGVIIFSKIFSNLKT